MGDSVLSLELVLRVTQEKLSEKKTEGKEKRERRGMRETEGREERKEEEKTERKTGKDNRRKTELCLSRVHFQFPDEKCWSLLIPLRLLLQTHF